MFVIGLTGGIASGKSTAAEYLRVLGATLIDADRVGHRSYEPGTTGFEKVVNAFGHDIVGFHAVDAPLPRLIAPHLEIAFDLPGSPFKLLD